MGRNRGVNLLQFADSVVAMSAVFLLLFFGFHPLWACTAFNLGLIVNFILTMWLLTRRTGLRFVLRILDRAVARVLITEIAVYIILSSVHNLMGPSLLTLATVCILSVLLFLVATLLWLLPPAQSQTLLAYLCFRKYRRESIEGEV